MGRRTALYDAHVAAGARIVDFGGWDMPLHYGSQLEEHHAVRRHAGVFDVAHMAAIDVQGAGARELLRGLLANDVARLDTPGRALYSCMLAEDGGVLDDLIVYFLEEARFRLVVNAGTREKDLAWIAARAANRDVQLHLRDDLGILAVQGPHARELATAGLDPAHRQRSMALKPFHGADCGEVFIARTGYTGEDGFELMVPVTKLPMHWQRLLDGGAAACGLGARDTLRLEAGMNLYGSDMDESTTPLESALGWTVAFDPPDRDFIGRRALERQRAAGVPRRLIGLVLEERGVLRPHQTVLAAGQPAGATTSGSFSPTLGRSIALARIGADHDGPLEVDVRGRTLGVRIVKPPFVRHGKSLI